MVLLHLFFVTLRMAATPSATVVSHWQGPQLCIKVNEQPFPFNAHQVNDASVWALALVRMRQTNTIMEYINDYVLP